MPTSEDVIDGSFKLKPKHNGLSFIMEIKDASIRFDGFFVDINSALILKLNDDRLSKGTDNYFNNGDSVHISFSIYDKFFFFQSQITNIITEPTLLLIITSPKKIEEYERRRGDRSNCKLPCKIILKNNKIKASITNISDSGCKCELYDSSLIDKASMHFFYEDNCPVNILLSVKETVNEQSFNGKLKYFKEADKSYEVGVEFFFANAEEIAALETIVSSI
ncbi:MAG: PilZ domain-containing protein [Nitrospirae bacterium]|nr:PilZ domain-containing protein [Nitrospirota bacterium]MBF0535867.1 PilZ domain-containing protein [Nitrospirota bacterium]MBF0617799.1 PilZ domain-containing protein [Nitrospirota bacterium]